MKRTAINIYYLFKLNQNLLLYIMQWEKEDVLMPSSWDVSLEWQKSFEWKTLRLNDIDQLSKTICGQEIFPRSNQTVNGIPFSLLSSLPVRFLKGWLETARCDRSYAWHENWFGILRHISMRDVTCSLKTVSLFLWNCKENRWN